MITLDRNGQMYEFLTRYSNAPLPRDLCSLIRALIFKVLAVWAIGTLLACLVWFFFHGLFELLAYPFRGYVVWPAAVGVTLAVLLLAGCGVMVCWLDDWAARRAPKEPGMFRQAYRAWKEKYCPVVTWEVGDGR